MNETFEYGGGEVDHRHFAISPLTFGRILIGGENDENGKLRDFFHVGENRDYNLSAIFCDDGVSGKKMFTVFNMAKIEIF
jgi:hypothetical protein